MALQWLLASPRAGAARAFAAAARPSACGAAVAALGGAGSAAPRSALAGWGPARWFSSAAAASRLRVCVVGSGPAGMYTAEKLLKIHGDNVEVTVLDRLPTPFGLVRSGVAPDHPATKNVVNQFGACLADPRVDFLGNVEVGRDVSVEELRGMYHALVVASGASADRSMGVPGEGLGNSLSAREFVFWYNGHPDFRDLPVDLTSHDTAVIFGQGNVAVDCARVLLQPPERLSTTDVAQHALDALRSSTIRRVLLVGRRGPAQGAFAPKELRELLGMGTAVGMDGVQLHIPQEEMEVSELDKAEMKAARRCKRVYDVLSKAVAESPSSPPAAEGRELHVRFFRSPHALLADPSGLAVSSVVLERNVLEPGKAEGAPQRAVGTGETEEVPAGLVLRSIGYRSVQFPGLPFDGARHVVPSGEGGRVIERAEAGAATVAGVYVAGWLRRGPSGIIGTNLPDADDAARSITEDLASGALPGGGDGGLAGSAALCELLASRGARAVSADGWARIDAAEVAAGEGVGKPREKLPTFEELLAAAGV